MLLPEIFVMVGLPASGKTSKAKEIAKEKDAVYVSSDELRKELLDSEYDQSDNEIVFNEMYHRVIEALKKNRNVVYDACNISSKRRVNLLKQINKYNCTKTCVVMYKPYAKCLEDNSNRERKVPESAIKRMLMNFYFPHYFEGWDNIQICGTENCKASNEDLINLFYAKDGLCYIEHDNPHHTLTIGNHCVATYMNCIQEFNGSDRENRNLALAALFHDIGKPFTKKFENHDGEPTEKAHYYQHHLVSGYFAVPFLCNRESYINKSDMLDILTMIDYHMHPYFWEKENNEKMKEKYKNLWGDRLFKNIIALHEADRKAH